eukprot:5794932-Amphidinium_carterae.1
MEFPENVVPVSRKPEVSDTTSGRMPSTVSFGAVSSGSQKPEESTLTQGEKEIKHASKTKNGNGCYLCGQEEGDRSEDEPGNANLQVMLVDG